MGPAGEDRNQVEPTSPQPSVDRLSVSFANEEKKVENDSIIKTSITEDDKDEDGKGEEEEYSASAQVILERKKDSLRRRGSVAADRRRSSVFNSTSESGVSMEDATNQNLRIHKEVVSQLKYQPWPIRRKLKLVRQAKAYIKVHEGQIQERLAQKKSTRDILEHSKIVFLHYWNYCMRELDNLINSLSPWESRIKEIESHFGSAVASYFTFHRWLFAVNFKISWALLLFVILPEVFLASNDPKFAGDRKCMFLEEADNSRKFLTLWNFEGILKHSPIFYGYYNSKNTSSSSFRNRLPFFYFVTGVGLYIYSFIAILRKMAENSRHSKLTEKDEYYIFTWKMFTSWDFMIGNPETAHNRTSSIILGFKEALLEEAEKSREEKRNWKLFTIRLATHLVVLCLLASSVLLVVVVVGRSQIGQAGKQVAKPQGWWRQNEVTVVITLLGMIYPVLFELISLLEKYHPRKALRLQLARIMVLNLLNLYAFILATFTSIHALSIASCENLPAIDMIEGYKENIVQTVKLDNGTSQLILNDFNFPPNLNISKNELSKSISNLYDPSQVSNGINSKYGLPNIPLLNFPYEHLNGHNTPYRAEGPTNLPKYLTTHEPIDFYRMQSSLKYNTGYESSERTSNQERTSDFETTASPGTSTTMRDEASPTGHFSLRSTRSESYENVYYKEENFETTLATDETYSSSDSTLTSTAPVQNTEVIPTQETSDQLTSSSSTMLTVSPVDTGTSDYLTSSSLTMPIDPTINGGISDYLRSSSSILPTGPNIVRGTSDYLTSSSSITPIASTIYRETSDYLAPSSSGIPPDSTATGATSSYHLTPDYSLESTTETLMHKGITDVLTSNWSGTCDNRAENMDFSPYAFLLEQKSRKKVHSQCWETMFGQELVKLTVMDLTMTVVSILTMDFLRAVLVRYMNMCWFWDLEKDLPGYGDFKIAENILHLVNNQGMVWMGMFFSPGLPLVNLFKLVVLMYVRSWAVLTCNVPHEVVFKASKSNNFYFGLLLTMLFLCVLPVGCALAWIGPSWHCGPFSKYHKIYSVFTYSLPKTAQYILFYVFSPGIVIPLLVLLILIIFYLISLTSALREANDDLKIQLRTERTEERRKVFQMASKKRRGLDNSENAFRKWCHVVNENHSAKTSIDITSSFAASEKHPKSNKSTTIKDPKEDHGKGPQDATHTAADSPPGDLPAHSSEDTERTDSFPGSYRGREDSIVSGWSADNIPEIRVSESDSLERTISKFSPDTYSQSKSSSKETIINIEESPSEQGQDDVFLPVEEKGQNDKQDETESSMGHGDSYESISKSLTEMNEIGNKDPPKAVDESQHNRKTLAKILVDGLLKK